LENNSETFAATFIKSTMMVDVPESPRDDNGKELDPNFGYKYYKRTIFDNIDFSDKKDFEDAKFLWKGRRVYGKNDRQAP
jgi:hypothetical protein